MPIYVASSLMPKNGGLFFLVEDKYLRGGFQVVADAAARDDIMTMNRKAGMLVFVTATQTLYQLDGDLSTWQVFTATPATHTHPATDLTTDATRRFVTDADVSTWNAKQDALGYVPQNPSEKGQPNGYASLGADGKVPTAQIPDLAITAVHVVASQAEMLALSCQVGDVAIRTDLTKTFILRTGLPDTLSNWQELLAPTTGGVTSVSVTAPISNSGTAQAPNISMAAATAGNNGYMTSAYAAKLDSIADNATAYTHPTGDGNLHVPATGTTNNGKVLTAGATAGSLSWATPAAGGVTSVTGTAPIASSGGTTPAISISAATTSAAGSMSAADKTKLDGIATGATAVGSATNLQVNSLGVGTAAAGTAGDIRATGDVTAFYSDERLKDVRGPILGALEKVLALNGVVYYGNEVAQSFGYDGNKEQVGLLAQQVQAVLPQVVVPAPFDILLQPDGTEVSKSGENYMTVKYERVIPLLVEAIKEQQAEINGLKQALGIQ